MALVLKDRVKVLATTTGTGTFTLGSAVTGYQDFSVIGNGNSTYYAIVAQSTPDWEVGIGTYTASGTLLSRDTILESSNGGAAVDFPAGTKDVFVTYPAERSVYLDSAGSYPVQNTFDTLNAANAVLTAGTISTAPTSSTDIANKSYVDTIAAAGISYHAPVRVESPTPLNATYNNGTSGVGATLTNAGTQAALVIDGITLSVNDRVLVYTQTNATQNGVYVVTDMGSVSTNWVLTRATDADSYAPNDPNALGQGDGFYVTSGNTGAGELYVCNTVGTITFGTTNITFAQVSSAQIYSAGTGLTLTNTTFSIADTGTAGTYGSTSNVPVFTTNAQGQVTSVTNTAIAIAAGAVSGLAASATTDTTNASNITSGTLGTGRLSGSYTGITGVGTLTAGTWNGGTIAANYGGTGFSSYTAGDLLYADTSTSLAKLADVAVGNALISGGVAANPSWGKIGLTTHVDGVLPIANGGTNATTASGALTNLGAYPATNPNGYTSNTGTVTSVAATAGTGISVTGSPITTSGTLTITNTAPDQVVSITGAGTTSVTGTYPNFTVTSNDQYSGTVTSVSGTGGYGGLTLSGTVTTSGNITLGGTPTGTWPISVSGNAVNLSTTRSNWSTNGTISAVVGQLSWKNYGNGHTIFDASASTSPDGGAVNNTNAAVAWSATYPTLMGWNGSSTYGVRVDSARTADTLSGVVAIANGGTGQTTLAAASIVTYAGTETLTNKRINPRAVTETSNGTPSINSDTTDIYGLTAQAVNITSVTVTGTPVNGQKLWIYIVGTAARTITWGASFEASTVALPTTTVSTNRLDVGFVWNAATSKWRCVASA